MAKRIRLSIPSALSEDLKSLLQIDSETLDKVHREISSAENLNTPEKIDATLATVLDAEIASTLTGFALATETVGKSEDVSLDDFFSSFRTSLEDLNWTSEELEEFDRLVPFVSELIKLSAFNETSQLAEARTNLGNHLHKFNFQVLCNPVFDDESKSILAQLAFTKLSIVCASESEVEKELSVVLSLKQLQRLRDDCETAIAQLEAFKKICEEPRVVILGDDGE